MIKNKDDDRNKYVVHETVELRGSIKDEKLQKLMQKSLRRAMREKK
jgi:hypothetical protein